jgi:hypothetical protein
LFLSILCLIIYFWHKFCLVGACALF